MTGNVDSRLKSLGIELPQPPKPLAAYVGFVREGDLVFVSGQLPMVGGMVSMSGLLGRNVTIEQGAEAARVCAINLLAQVNLACEGDLDRVQRCVRLGGFVACVPEFTDHPKVINGASNLIGEVFGDKGLHARAAVGVASLPLNACVEVEGVFSVR
jgi:enamine deaminase RidA (YjgF/YER057c/UK114 family)